MTPRKGHKVTVIKDGKEAVAANLGEAQRMTGVSVWMIRYRMEHGGDTRGWRFKEASK